MKRFPEAEKVLLESQSELVALKGADDRATKEAQLRLTQLYNVTKK